MLQCDKPGDCDKLDCWDCEWSVDEDPKDFDPETCDPFDPYDPAPM
jgi:hypothetical protein